jgi:hypothetical protein
MVYAHTMIGLQGRPCHVGATVPVIMKTDAIASAPRLITVT